MKKKEPNFEWNKTIEDLAKLRNTVVTESKNMWLEKLKEDLLQNKYNLTKVGLYNGLIKEGIIKHHIN